MAEGISIYGQVRSYESAPIFMIKVSVYRDTKLLSHEYTNNDGRYWVRVPAGESITIRFDTHPTLNNSRGWHPSVIARLEAGKDIMLDCLIVKVGASGGCSA